MRGIRRASREQGSNRSLSVWLVHRFDSSKCSCLNQAPSFSTNWRTSSSSTREPSRKLSWFCIDELLSCTVVVSFSTKYPHQLFGLFFIYQEAIETCHTCIYYSFCDFTCRLTGSCYRAVPLWWQHLRRCACSAFVCSSTVSASTPTSSSKRWDSLHVVTLSMLLLINKTFQLVKPFYCHL